MVNAVGRKSISLNRNTPTNLNIPKQEQTPNTINSYDNIKAKL
ncbi:MAG: hypothetical protein U9Q66_01970 [Patescibacteria group bacterium]|nr:hypothetical protein [Patescibacteria group bacterium]